MPSSRIARLGRALASAALLLALAVLINAAGPRSDARADQYYFDNFNGLIVCPFGGGSGNGVVCNGDGNYAGPPSLRTAPPTATTFTLSGSQYINYVATYHFCFASTTQTCSNPAPSTLSSLMRILDAGNNVVASFTISNASNNASGTLYGNPDVTLGAGTYTLVDTQNASTWSYNTVTTGNPTINNQVVSAPCNITATGNSLPTAGIGTCLPAQAYGYNDNNAGFAIIGDVANPTPSTSAVPEPASLLLLGSALAPLALRRRRR